MRITFRAITPDHPVGGAIAYYEFANGMRRRGHDVNIIHRLVGNAHYTTPEQIQWAKFEDGIGHHFASGPIELPEADFVCPAPKAHAPSNGLPFDIMQGYGSGLAASQEDEDRAVRAPYPRVCLSKWLADVAKHLGVPNHQVVQIPNGIDHGKYRVRTPIEDRPLQVSMCYSNHEQKGPGAGLRALATVLRRVPEVRVVVFSQRAPVHEVPRGVTFLTNPPQPVIVEEVYNRSRVFLCSSRVEGFPLTLVESMACGAALVTTANRGSDEFAVHGSTALVCKPGDVTAMASHIETLLRDDEQRVRIARQGEEFVRRFDWDVSAERLERFLLEYSSDPERYQQPALVG